MKILIIFTSLLFLYFPICFAQNEVLNNFPDSIYSGKQSRFHVQGIAIDKRNGFVYFSFTDRLIKTDLSGKILGSVTGIVGHLGDLAFNEETEEVYASLEYKNDAIGKGISNTIGNQENKENAFYIAIFNGLGIIRENMNAEENGILRTVFLKEVVEDFEAKSLIKGNLVKHRFGCSGIDGITFGTAFGNKKNQKKYLYVAYGIYSDTSREDNNYQVLLKYDISDWMKYNSKLSQRSLHRLGPDKPLQKYFIKTGNTRYGIQNLAFDDYSGNFYAAVYPGIKSEFPNYSLFVIDGKRSPVKEKIISFDKSIEVETLTLAHQGLEDKTSGIRGWYFNKGATGIFPLGEGLFYISHNNKSEEGEHETMLYKYKWTGSAEKPFLRKDD